MSVIIAKDSAFRRRQWTQCRPSAAAAAAMLRLRSGLLSMLRAASQLPAPQHPRPCCLLSTSTTAVPFSLEDYLVAACGLAPAQAREVSKKAFRELCRKSSKEGISRSRLLSASNPDAIIALLAGTGLSRDDIVAAVSADPLLLRASVKNIAPRLLALRDRVGLSTPQIARFLLIGPGALRHSGVVPQLEFFISFYGLFEQVLVALKRNRRLLCTSLEKLIKPNIALLRQWGVRDIAQLCSNVPRVLNFNPERVKEFLLRAEQLGVPPTSRLFRHAVAVVACMSGAKVAAKLEFLKRSLCCSEPEVSTAVSKMPYILGLSDEVLLRKIEFLVNKAAMEPRHIVERPHPAHIQPGEEASATALCTEGPAGKGIAE
jgi:mTERF domain-containing protein, mitochondrial